MGSRPCLPPLGAPALELRTREDIDRRLRLLNAETPWMLRQVADWAAPAGDEGRLSLNAAPCPSPCAGWGACLAESRLGFALSIGAFREAPCSAPYLACLLLQGSMQVHGGGFGEQTVHAGQGLVVDLAELRHLRLDAGAHLVEFVLPKASMVDAGAHALPQFEPLLPAPLAERLLFMAREAGHALQAAGGRDERPFRRWLETICSVLLQEQPLRNAAASARAGRHALPASTQRALNFLEANAAAPIELRDIAQAAGISISGLGRAFRHQLGQTPMALLRDLRLDRLREELRLGSGPDRLRDLARRWRFQSASQFSQAYKRRFGERPSETAARARGSR